MAGPRQRKRAPKTSKGTARGAKKTRLTGLEKILLGHGFHDNITKKNFGKKARSGSQG